MTQADDLIHDPGLRLDVGRPRRVAVGMLWQETNSFNPLATTAADFIVDRGEAVIAAHAGAATTLGGIIRRLKRLGAEPVPIMAAKARPGGPVDDAAIEELMDEMVDAIARRRPDAVCLELHGAIAGQGIDDVEGELLARIRVAVGAGVPIVAGLDLHGNCTARMVAQADYLTAYRTQPHADMVETGERAAAGVAAMLTRSLRLRSARVALPFIALANDETDDPPMRAVWTEARHAILATGSQLFDLSIFNVHPFLDVPEMSQTVLAYASDGTHSAGAVASRVAVALSGVKTAFAACGTPVETVLAQVAAAPAGSPTVAIGDQGDSVLAGTPGDSVDVARTAAMAFPALKGFAPVFDPDAVRVARACGVGGTGRFRIGGSVSPGLAPIEGDGRVERLTDGRFVNTAAYMTGLVNDLGDCAVIRLGSLVLLVTSKAPVACDPAMIAHAGYAVDDFAFVLLKSGNHFKLSFAPDHPCLVAASAGLSSRDPAMLRHVRSDLDRATGSIVSLNG